MGSFIQVERYSNHFTGVIPLKWTAVKSFRLLPITTGAPFDEIGMKVASAWLDSAAGMEPGRKRHEVDGANYPKMALDCFTHYGKVISF